MKMRISGFFCLSLIIFLLAGCQVQSHTQAPLQETTQLPEVDTSPSLLTETPVSTATDAHSPVPIITDTDLPIVSDLAIFTFNMFTPDHGWALTQDYDRLLRTVDGGSTWLDATPVELHPLPSDVAALWIEAFFLDAETAWFTPNSLGGVLYQTRDGGVHWTTTAIPFERARYYFLDVNTGYAMVDLGAGAGSHYVAIYRTLDGGTTWTMVFTHEPGEIKSLPNSGSKNGITFRDVDHGWMGGAIPMDDYFYLFYTEDGGATWAQETDIALPEDYTGSMLDVWQPVFLDATSAFLPVRAYLPGGGIDLLIYRSDDDGETWSFRGGVEGGAAVDFISVNQGWVAAGTALFQTLDGGVTWSESPIAGIPAGEVFLMVDFVDSLNGWVLATPDDSTWEPLKLYRTADGGENWSLLLP